MYYIYFAKSLKNNKIYVGKTEKDPNERVKEHNAGSNEWSKRNKPLELVYFEKYYCKTDMSMRELFYKTGMGKKIKLAIVNSMGR